MIDGKWKVKYITIEGTIETWLKIRKSQGISINHKYPKSG